MRRRAAASSRNGARILSFPPHDSQTLNRLVAIAEEAGALALGFFHRGGKTKAGVSWKGDGSPVTEADMAVNAFLEDRLQALWPAAAWLSEESADDTSRLTADRVIIVDPIDGTRGFARGDDHWAISVALVEHGRPIVGVVHGPALKETYAATAGGGAMLNGKPLHVRHEQPDDADLQITCPNALATAMRAAGFQYDFRPRIASLALRIVMVASGVYSAGFTARNSHDWDLAAADLILQEAGGLLVGRDGKPLVYNKADPSHPALVASPRGLEATLRDALARASLGQQDQ